MWTINVLLTISFILLSSPTPSILNDPIPHSVTNALNWINWSRSKEAKNESDPCNVSPSLGYLRSHLNLILPTYDPEPHSNDEETKFEINLESYSQLLDPQPLVYSFYSKNVIEPYHSRYDEADAQSTIFCYLDIPQQVCDDKKTDCNWERETAVCFPNSDATTEGSCVPCRHLKTELEKGKLKNETSIGHLMATCHPTSRGPKPVPERRPDEKNSTEEVRYLRWFLESSYVFEGKRRGRSCSASPRLSRSRAYLHRLMEKHFGKMNVSGSLSLTTPGKEGGNEEEEAAYEGVRAELSGKHRKWFESKLQGIEEWKEDFGEVYCSREEGLICVDGGCWGCEGGWENKLIMEACNLEEVPKEEEEHEEEEKGSSGKKVGSSGAQDGKHFSEFTTILGIVCSTILRSL
jgi:hypothetical protein